MAFRKTGRKLAEGALALGGLGIGTSVLSGAVTSAGGSAAGLQNLSNIAFPSLGTIIGTGATLQMVSEMGQFDLSKRKIRRREAFF